MSSPEPGYDTPSPAAQYNSPPALIAFTLAILVLCFVAFSIVYLCKYCLVSVIHSWAFQQSSSGSLGRLSPNRSPSIGLDPSLLQAFPAFVYSSVKDLRKKKYGLECAICLLEFEDDSMIRLLTVCCHVFHQECIDLWLRSHKTCPVCRIDLDSSSMQTQKSGDNCNHNHNHAEGEIENSGDIRIDIREAEGGEHAGGGGDNRCDEHDHDHDSVQQQQEHKFARSHSTGHSIVLIRGEGDEEKEDDKYTLRLPEHIIRGRHNCSKSCTTYQEMQMTRHCSNCGFVESVSGCSNSLGHT